MADSERFRSRSPRLSNEAEFEPTQFPPMRIFIIRLLRPNSGKELYELASEFRAALLGCATQRWSFAQKFNVLLVLALLDFCLAHQRMEGSHEEDADVVGSIGNVILSKLDAVGTNCYQDGYRDVFQTSLLHSILKREDSGASFRWNAAFLHTFMIVFNRYLNERCVEWLECNRAIGDLLLENLEKSGHMDCFICSESLRDLWNDHLNRCLDQVDLCPSAILVSTCGHATCVRCFSILTGSPEHRLDHEGSTGMCRVCKQPFVWPDHVAQMLVCFSAQWILQASFFKTSATPRVTPNRLIRLISDYCIDLETSLFPKSAMDRHDIWEVIQLRYTDARGLVPLTSRIRREVKSRLEQKNEDNDGNATEDEGTNHEGEDSDEENGDTSEQESDDSEEESDDSEEESDDSEEESNDSQEESGIVSIVELECDGENDFILEEEDDCENDSSVEGESDCESDTSLEEESDESETSGYKCDEDRQGLSCRLRIGATPVCNSVR